MFETAEENESNVKKAKNDDVATESTQFHSGQQSYGFAKLASSEVTINIENGKSTVKDVNTSTQESVESNQRGLLSLVLE